MTILYLLVHSPIPLTDLSPPIHFPLLLRYPLPPFHLTSPPHIVSKREVKIKPIYECRCDERLKTKAEESTRLTYTGLLGELEHLKTKTRLIDEMFASVMGEYVVLN
jgi:hypothetical protein